MQNQIVASKGAMEEALEKGQWDVILCDNSMPDFDALRAIEVRNILARLVPFIIVSEDICQKDILKAMEAGCCAYLAKKNLNMLGKLVENILAYEEIWSKTW